MPTVDPAGYQDQLTRLDGDLAAALALVARARDPEELARAVLAAAARASSAGERLRGMPVDLATRRAHDVLARALDQFGRELAYLGQRVYAHDICTAPAAGYAISTAPSMPALRAVSTGLGLPGADGRTYRWGASLPVEPIAPPAVVPLTSGAILVDRRTPGGPAEGILEVTNEAEDDAVVLLGAHGAALVSVAVPAGTSTRVTGIPDGDHELGYTSGRDWDPGLAAFGRDCRFRRFSAPVSFRTGPAPGGGTEYTVRTVTVRPGPPDATTVDVLAHELLR